MADDIGLSVQESIAANATVQAISSRCYIGALPQNATLPATVVDVVSNNAVEYLAGSALSVARVRVDAYAAPGSRSTASSLSEAVRLNVLKSNLKGTLGVTNSIGVREVTLVSGPYWEQDAPADGSDEWRLFVRSDYFVTYVQTGPS